MCISSTHSVLHDLLFSFTFAYLFVSLPYFAHYFISNNNYEKIWKNTKQTFDTFFNYQIVDFYVVTGDFKLPDTQLV